jgi:hypothetical protein
MPAQAGARIDGLEIRCDDPERAAQVWSTALSRGEAGRSGGEPTLHIGGTSVRFSAPSAGEPGGVTCLLAVPDRPRVLRAAGRAGFSVSDTGFVACGTQFRLVAERSRCDG